MGFAGMPTQSPTVASTRAPRDSSPPGRNATPAVSGWVAWAVAKEAKLAALARGVLRFGP